jgi:HD domain-containing protein
MRARTLTRPLFWTAEVLLLAGTVSAAVLLASAPEWHPAMLVLLLLVLSLLGQWLSIEIPSGELSAALIAIVLAMGLLGPGPAAACGVAAMVLTSAMRRVPLTRWLSNLATFAVVPFAGGLAVRAASDALHIRGSHHLAQSISFGLVLFGVFIVTVGVNFLLVALDAHIDEGRPLAREIRDLLALLPGELATGALATILAIAYANVGLPVLFAAVAVLLIFRQLTVALLRSERRADALEARSRQLVGLQLGVLRTLLRALSMRDQTSGRHAAAVARYAKALAAELGCGEEGLDVVHAAGLLHEIGKFTWPDRVLRADVVDREDLPIVENHPEEGALLVGALDGYGPVADAILHHHERIDGRGYPAGLIGKEIPLASRILAICSTYDTITVPGGYRDAMTPAEAIDELRHGAASGQFDPELVERFITLLEREGAAFAADSDFENELEFERRVRAMAEPQGSHTATRTNPVNTDWRSAVRALAGRG